MRKPNLMIYFGTIYVMKFVGGGPGGDLNQLDEKMPWSGGMVIPLVQKWSGALQWSKNRPGVRSAKVKIPWSPGALIPLVPPFMERVRG